MQYAPATVVGIAAVVVVGSAAVVVGATVVVESAVAEIHTSNTSISNLTKNRHKDVSSHVIYPI